MVVVGVLSLETNQHKWHFLSAYILHGSGVQWALRKCQGIVRRVGENACENVSCEEINVSQSVHDLVREAEHHPLTHSPSVR